MPNRTCAADGCDKPAAYSAGGGLCGKHNWRLKHWGTTADPEPPSEVCAVEGCECPVETRGWCNMHYTRWRRHGDPLALAIRHNWSGDNVTYRALHKRLERKRGPASARSCIDCGAEARHWSYQGGDPDERVERGMRYTPNIEAYVPRCLSCHKRLDGYNPTGLEYGRQIRLDRLKARRGAGSA